MYKRNCAIVVVSHMGEGDTLQIIYHRLLVLNYNNKKIYLWKVWRLITKKENNFLTIKFNQNILHISRQKKTIQTIKDSDSYKNIHRVASRNKLKTNQPKCNPNYLLFHQGSKHRNLTDIQIISLNHSRLIN